MYTLLFSKILEKIYKVNLKSAYIPSLALVTPLL